MGKTVLTLSVLGMFSGQVKAQEGHDGHREAVLEMSTRGRPLRGVYGHKRPRAVGLPGGIEEVTE